MNNDEFKYKVLPLTQKVFPMAARLLGNDEEARDAVQEIMIKLWNKRKQLAEHPNIPGFVFTTARNYCLDMLKTKKVVFQEASEIKLNVIGNTDYPLYELKEVFQIIQQIITTLPENQGEVIMLRDLDGFEMDEISVMTGLKEEHVRVLLSRARKQVRIQLEKIYSYEQRTN